MVYAWIAGVLAYFYLLHQLSAVGRSAELELGKKLDDLVKAMKDTEDALREIKREIWDFRSMAQREFGRH